eukprot:8640432-Pyramimonas_sp.AAC.1
MTNRATEIRLRRRKHLAKPTLHGPHVLLRLIDLCREQQARSNLARAILDIERFHYRGPNMDDGAHYCKRRPTETVGHGQMVTSRARRTRTLPQP